MRNVVLLLVVLGITIAATPSMATEPTDADAIRRVIDDQIVAFQNDDGDRAFSHAAPGIRARFGSADFFMRMVRQNYRPLYRLRSYDFETLSIEDGTPVQPVRLVGPTGRISLALYQMERQPDGGWKIAGCVLVRLDENVT